MNKEDQNPILIMIVEQLRDIRSDIKDINTKIDENYQKLNTKIDESYQKLDAKIDENYQIHESSIKQLNNQRITWSSTLITVVFLGSILANIILARLFPFLYKVAENTEPITTIAQI